MDFLSYTPDYDDIADRYADLVDQIFKPQNRQTQPQKFNTYDQPENCNRSQIRAGPSNLCRPPS
jgi:hypothetical protein